VLNVAKRLYEERTGEQMDWRSDPGDLGQQMPGERWKDEDLPELLPRLARIHLESKGGSAEPGDTVEGAT
jgi:hypothetical protein